MKTDNLRYVHGVESRKGGEKEKRETTSFPQTNYITDKLWYPDPKSQT